jgi:SAM-dependent methyltransferase
MWIFFIIAAILLIALIFALALSFYSFLIGAPYLWTPKKALKEILEIIKIKPGDVFYDLGAGGGTALILAEKKFKARAIGFELSPIINLFAKLHLLLRRAGSSKVYLKNFYKQDLSDANVIFCFLTVGAMEKLKPKFERELRRGTKIISYCFSIHGWNAKKIIRDKFPGNIYFYEI